MNALRSQVAWLMQSFSERDTHYVHLILACAYVFYFILHSLLYFSGLQFCVCACWMVDESFLFGVFSLYKIQLPFTVNMIKLSYLHTTANSLGISLSISLHVNG